MTFRQVMKAPNEIIPFDDERIRYPMYASIKYDGFRMLAMCGDKFLSPANKDIPNVNLRLRWQDLWKRAEQFRWVFDGEIWSPELTFQQLQSIVRSRFEPIPDHVKFYVFDAMTENEWDDHCDRPYGERYSQVVQYLSGFPGVVGVEQLPVHNAEEAQRLYEAAIDRGDEGLMLRCPGETYKHGRCTHNESWMFKFKQFDTKDGVIIAVNQRYKLRSNIIRTETRLGLLERVHEQDAYEPDQAVGSFTVQWQDSTFNVSPGRGFSLEDRRKWWTQNVEDPLHFIGKHIEFKFMPKGTADKPRIGSLVRFRPDLD